MTPFEVFRTPIQILRFTGGFYFNGFWQDGSQIVLGGALVTGNIVNITLNGVALTPIPFTTSSANTLLLIQVALLAQPNVSAVDIQGLTISVIPVQPFRSAVSVFTVTGGASQPTVTIANSPTVINATASVQPTEGDEVMLIPEARRDSEHYSFYTSTQILGVTTQNPDQVTVLKAPFAGIIFEVVQIWDWQNNNTFLNVNHYKYVAMRLNPLP